uniref:Uncharacterized protein n=1 Tax=Amphimedon queenslandica TaxID=400682 RepID=A0A1X7SZN2_AMPQE
MLRIWNWACIRIIKFLQSVWIQIKNIFHPKQHNDVQIETSSYKTMPVQPEGTVIDIEVPVPNGKAIGEGMKESTCNDISDNTSGHIKEHTKRSHMSVVDGSSHTDISEGNPMDVLQSCTDKLVPAISVNIYSVTESLYAKGLILQQTKAEMHVLGVTDEEKASKLMYVIETQLEGSLNPKQYLIKICHVLMHQQHCTLRDIVSSMLKELGYSIPDVITFIKSLPDDVQGYADNMRKCYKKQSVVATDWPPKIGKDYFGRLALIEKQILDFSTDVKESAWHMLSICGLI